MIIKAIKPEDTLPIRQLVMWPNKPLEFVRIKEDVYGSHYGLFIEDTKLISVISYFEKNNVVQFRKFATLTTMQGLGFGSILLNKIIDIAKNKGAEKVWCNARADKIEFYKKFGLECTDESFIKEGIKFIIMELKFK